MCTDDQSNFNTTLFFCCPLIIFLSDPMGAAALISSRSSFPAFPSSPEKIHKNLSMEYQIGEGGFSQVFLSTNKSDNAKVAVKQINILSALSHTRGLDALSNELQVFKRIGCHENIVKLHCAYRLKNYFYFVMDCLLGGDLRQYVHRNGRLSQQAICYMIASLGSGLHHMHQRGVFHRDIKPENIAFDQKGTPYLTDFKTILLPPPWCLVNRVALSHTWLLRS
jgi:hypothetical protein